MLFTNATIITVNKRREIILDGAILVKDNLIAAVGKTVDLLKEHQEQHEVVDLKGRIIIPGLISTHMHTAQTLLRGEDLLFYVLCRL
jgi:cytosine/adenosine deaminase-related metal-dependent hydrolase